MAKPSSDVRKQENRLKTPDLDADGDAFEKSRRADEVQRLLKENEQRNAELAIISSVQKGLASKLELQSIIDLVGDQVHAITNAKSISIALYDKATGVISWPYWVTLGKRIEITAIRTEKSITQHVMYADQPLNLGTEEEILAHDAISPQDGWTVGKSFLGVPFTVGNAMLGALSLHDFDNEYAFDESDERLLQTLANSMSLALENARLFDETERLLRETEQRAAELAIINSVQEGLSSKLDVQAIYDLVGNKIRDIFHAQGTAIYLFNYKTEILETPYCYLKKRFEIEARPFSDHPIAKLMVNTHQPITYHTVGEYRALGGAVLENSEEYKSGMYVPLLVGKELKGMVGIANLDKENAYYDSDLQLLQTLANSLSVALENARLFDETQRLFRLEQQRAAELQIINRVQEGLATKLDIQAIYDLVGNKIREIFPNTDAEIRIYDPKTNLIHFPYFVDNGQRVAVDPIPLTDSGISSYVLRTGQTLVINENFLREAEKFGSTPILLGGAGHLAKSALFVPLMVNNQARGLLVLGNVEREHAFSNSDVRLFQTLVNSMSTALENARLFDETQSLLKETEQRNAELAIINSVQAGLASKLDMQAIYDLVGDKIRDLLNTQSVWIITFDPSTRTRRVRYSFENGQRYYTSELFPYNKLTEHLIATKKPLVINQNFAEAITRFEMVNMAGTQQQIKSIVYIPILAGEDVNGFISLPNTERENAFSESDVNLISTFASSMSIALENIRLFDETRRLLKEAEQRATELAIINSIQEGLASKLDMQAIYDLVGDKLRDLFNTQAILIVTLDPANRSREIKYFCETGQRYYTSELFPYNQLTEYLIATKKTLVINQDAEAQIAELEMVVISKTFKSAVFVPLIAGGEVKGFITIQNLEQENAFSDSDVNLLSTFAASMSAALENARLFDVTQRLLKETEQANQAKSAFLSSMSHELRTPLNAIINFVEMVARGMIGPVSQEQVELLDQALHSSKHLLNLINDVLDISKIQAGQLTLFIEDQVSVQVEMEAALSILGGLLQEKNLHLIRDIDPHLPMISCDRRRLRQVLLNLISNAIKFTNAGTVTVSVKDQGHEVMFAVIDTGPGIPQNKVDLIFEPFLQAENGEREVQGTGLGLPISRSLVRAHGGELWVDSQPGEGSIFYFTLPVKRRSAP